MGRFTGVDSHADTYLAWSLYAYVLDNLTRLVDPDGKDPEDVLIAFSGGRFSGDQDVEIIRDLRTALNTRFPSEGGGVAFACTSPVHVIDNSVETALSVETLNDLTQVAYEAVVSSYNMHNGNQVDGGKIVIAGFSCGGVLAEHLSERLGNAGYDVKGLVTLDAALGDWGSNQVDRIIHDYVECNLNVYQTDNTRRWRGNKVGSYGAPNQRENGSIRGITNLSTDSSHENVDDDHYDDMLNEVNSYFDERN